MLLLTTIGKKGSSKAFENQKKKKKQE